MLLSSVMWPEVDRSLLLGKHCLGEMLDPFVGPASSSGVHVDFFFLLSPGKLSK